MNRQVYEMAQRVGPKSLVDEMELQRLDPSVEVVLFNLDGGWPKGDRRRPFQGCRTIQLSGQESADVFEDKAFMFGRF
jgi:hypothetical protein